jgi:hypothetical protein
MPTTSAPLGESDGEQALPLGGVAVPERKTVAAFMIQTRFGQKHTIPFAGTSGVKHVVIDLATISMWIRSVRCIGPGEVLMELFAVP